MERITAYPAKKLTKYEQNTIRNQWCDQLCHYFNVYFKNKQKSTIRTPAYTSKILSYLGLIDFEDIDHNDKIKLDSSHRSHNEDLIYKCFDELINKRDFIGNYLHELRNEFSNNMPF